MASLSDIGKTRLAIALERDVCRRGTPAHYHTAAGLVMRLLHTPRPAVVNSSMKTPLKPLL